MLNKKFIIAIKLGTIPQYKLAFSVGLHPNTLSKIIHGAVRIKLGDERLIRIGKLLGLKPEEIFDEVSHV